MWIVNLQGIVPVPGMRTLKVDSLSLTGWKNVTKKPRQSLVFQEFCILFVVCLGWVVVFEVPPSGMVLPGGLVGLR